MTVTVAELIARSVRRMGGFTSTLGTVTVGGSTTTAVLNGLVNTTLDDTFYAGQRLFLPESAVGSQETMVTNWADATGTATFRNLTDAPALGEDYMLAYRCDYTLTEFFAALNKALNASRRTYRYVIPTTPLLELYPLSDLTWLEGPGSVDAVWWSDSPIMLHNEDFSLWQNGSASAPDGYTFTGAGGSVARVSGGLRSAFNARITRVGTDVELTQEIPQSLSQWITRRSFPIFTPMRGAAWLICSTANVARMGIRYTDSGVSTTAWSDYHTGSGVPEYLTVSLTPTATMDNFTFVYQVANSNTSADIGAAVLMQNTLSASQAYQVRDQGSQAYREMPYTNAVRSIGGVPTIDVRGWPGTYGQLIVYSRRPFPAVSVMADVVEEQDARGIEAGMTTFLLDNVKPQQDRARINLILNGDRAQGVTGERQRWVAFLQQSVQVPVPKPMAFNLVESA